MTKPNNKPTRYHETFPRIKRLFLFSCVFVLPITQVNADTNPNLKQLLQTLPDTTKTVPQQTVKKVQPPVIPLLDPTKPPAFLLKQTQTNTAIAWEKSGIVLTAIYHYPHRTFAMINGNPAEIGETVNGFKIIKISKTAVWFQGADNDTHILRLFSSIRNE